MGEANHYQLSEKHIEAAAQIYERAFFNDPLFSFLLPKAHSRKKTLKIFFRGVVRYKVNYGEIYGVGEPIQAVATWKTPGVKTKESLHGVLHAGLWQLFFTPYLLSAARGIRLNRTAKELHKKYAPNKHFYLQMLSVVPESHGQGFSSKLVKPMLEKAEDMTLPVYLETSNPHNVKIYEHFGFTMVEHRTVPRSDLEIWAFIKEPKKS